MLASVCVCVQVLHLRLHIYSCLFGLSKETDIPMLEAVERHMWHHVQTYAFGESVSKCALSDGILGNYRQAGGQCYWHELQSKAAHFCRTRPALPNREKSFA